METNTSRSTERSRKRRLALLAVTVVLLQSCYHVRFVNKSGVAEPDPGNMSEDWYRGKQVDTIDTVIKVGLLNDDVMFLQDCPNGFFSTGPIPSTAMHVECPWRRSRRTTTT